MGCRSRLGLLRNDGRGHPRLSDFSSIEFRNYAILFCEQTESILYEKYLNPVPSMELRMEFGYSSCIFKMFGGAPR